MSPPSASLLPLAQLRKLVARFAATPEARATLFAGTDVTLEQVAAPDFAFTPTILWRICGNIRNAFGPAWYLGLPGLWGADLHGELELAMRTAPTLGASLKISVQFISTRWPFAASQLDIGRKFARFSMQRTEVVPLPDWQMTGIIAGLNTQWLVEHAFPDVVPHCRAEFEGPPPLTEAEMEKYFRIPVRWNSPMHCMMFPSRMLPTPSALADSRQCSAFIEMLSRDLAAPSRSMAARVANVLGDVASGRLRGKEVAHKMGVSYRTLARQLSVEGTSFEALRDASLKSRAEILFRTTRLGIAEVAEQLGYGDQTALARATRRWFDCTPVEAKQRLGAR